MVVIRRMRVLDEKVSKFSFVYGCDIKQIILDNFMLFVQFFYLLKVVNYVVYSYYEE